MRCRTLLITTGVVGARVGGVCCARPLLAVVFGAVGLTAWLAKADYVLIPTLILCLGLIGSVSTICGFKSVPAPHLMSHAPTRRSSERRPQSCSFGACNS